MQLKAKKRLHNLFDPNDMKTSNLGSLFLILSKNIPNDSSHGKCVSLCIYMQCVGFIRQ